MNQDWQTFLQSQNAILKENYVAHYGDISSELRSTSSKTILTDLSYLGLIYFSGEDALTFLEGQLSCDVSKIDLDRAQYNYQQHFAPL